MRGEDGPTLIRIAPVPLTVFVPAVRTHVGAPTARAGDREVVPLTAVIRVVVAVRESPVTAGQLTVPSGARGVRVRPGAGRAAGVAIARGLQRGFTAVRALTIAVASKSVAGVDPTAPCAASRGSIREHAGAVA